jgi:hypothetical protein
MRKILLVLGMFILLISLTSGAKVINFTKPLASVTDLNGFLTEGGSLSPGVTYRYKVITIGGLAGSWYSRFKTHSSPSNEFNITPNSTHQTINLNWTAIAGNGGYIVYQTYSAIEDYYGGNTRFPRETDGSSWGISTLDENFTQDGSIGLKAVNTISMIPPSYDVPNNISPANVGLGQLELSGGTSADPITFQNIYDNAVTNNWTNWTYYDGGQFTLSASMTVDTETETHFLCKGDVFNIFGWYYMAGVTGSSINFGTIGTNGQTLYGCHINWLGGASGSGFNIEANNNFYDSVVMSHQKTSSPYFMSGYSSSLYYNFNDGTAKDLKFQSYDNLFVRNDIAINGLEISSMYASVYNDLTRCQNVLSHSYHYVYYSHITRLDKFTSLQNLYNIRTFTTLKNVVHVDGSYPNTPDTDGLPAIAWADVYGNYVDIYHSIKLQVIDNNRNALSYSNITIHQLNGSLAKDFDGTEIEDFETDNEGRLWREKITITTNTTNTITDSSKSWGANEWVGRNVYIINGSGARQEMKVTSNTVDTLTFTEDFVTTPEVGSTAGIIMELKRVRLTHKAGSGAGYTPVDTYTTKTFLSPYTMKITSDNYIDKEVVYDLTKPTDLTITLEKPIFDYIAIQNNAGQSLIIK